ncbi:hypothetical protein ANO11243_044410 [Dothideomycetidae sp. 11243]|nr:hypothetical protein ANO11243_044410 [fungal sp. No.11243]
MGQKNGLGRHIWTLQGPQISRTAHYIAITESFSIITSYFGRMSFAAFLLSVIGKTAKVRRWILFTIIIVDTAINILVAVQTYVQCGKYVSALWNQEVAQHVSCQSTHVETYIGYVQASLNSLCDLILTVIPVTIVYKLKMPRATKFGLGALLTLSSFAFVASVAKAIEIQQLSSGPDFTCKSCQIKVSDCNTDRLVDHFAVLQFSVIMENDIVIIAGSVPLLRALWNKNSTSTDGRPSGYPGSSNRKSNNIVAPHRDRHSLSDDEMYILDRIPTAQLGGIEKTTETKVIVKDDMSEGDIDSRSEYR